MYSEGDHQAVKEGRLLIAVVILLLQKCTIVQAQDVPTIDNNSAAASQGTLHYDLPSISLRLLILDQDVNAHTFGMELTALLELHLEKMFAGALPDDGGDLDRQYFDQVELINPLLEKTFQGVPEDDETTANNNEGEDEEASSLALPVSLIRANFFNNKVRFLVPPGHGIPDANSSPSHLEARLNIARAALKDIVITALTGASYRQFVREIERNEILNIIQSNDITIVIDDQLISGNIQVVNGVDESSKLAGPRRTLQIIGAVFFGVLGAALIGAAGGMSYYYFDSKRNGLWNIQWKRTAEW